MELGESIEASKLQLNAAAAAVQQNWWVWRMREKIMTNWQIWQQKNQLVGNLALSLLLFSGTHYLRLCLFGEVTSLKKSVKV